MKTAHANLAPTSIFCIAQLAEFSGLLHDIGKLTQQFQNKLKKGEVVRDSISHEWISAWIVAHMLDQKNISWEGFLAAWDAWEKDGIRLMRKDTSKWRPFSALDSFSAASLMIIATHHRLFSLDPRATKGERTLTLPDSNTISPTANHVSSPIPLTEADTFWHRPPDWPSPPEKNRWERLLRQAAQLMENLSTHNNATPFLYWKKSSLIARSTMILADHHISAQVFSETSDAKSHKNSQVFANSIKENKKVKTNQPLTWHLNQVGNLAAQYTQNLAKTDLPALDTITRRQFYGDTSHTPPRFIWQTTAYEFIRLQRESTETNQTKPNAFLIFNVASTGAGKTRANICALESCRRDNDPLRISAGFNLKTLTLQTASVYRQELRLNDDEYACIIGDPLARALNLHEQLDDDKTQETHQFISAGCNSEKFQKNLPEWLDAMTGHDKQLQSLVAAPVLVCTMDYLAAAGDPSQQAHHTHTLLRIANSDLLIDEADSYDPEGLVAVLRVVQMAGMFGRNVLVSSATLPPVLADHIQRAWQSGIAMYKASDNTDLITHEIIISNLGGEQGFQCKRSSTECFENWYRATLAKTYSTTKPTYRLARIINIQSNTADAISKKFSADIATTCIQAHENQSWPATVNNQALNVSIGVIRMANVAPLQSLADALTRHEWPKEMLVKICPYHAKDVPIRRYQKEQALDSLLKRHGNPDLSQHAELQKIWPEILEETRHILLIVLASPIEEVGRDHDFDWAIIEPSSMHSLIQMAGRVNRHRLHTITKPNVFILERNVKKLSGESLCFTNPGLQQADPTETTRVPITHLSGLSSELLKPHSNETNFALDASLIFSIEKPCVFAQEDERALKLLLKDALPFFNENYNQWGCDWHYQRYPLRKREHQIQWRATPIAHTEQQITLHRYERTLQGRNWVYICDTTEIRSLNELTQWLCPSLHEASIWIQKQLENAGHEKNDRANLLENATTITMQSGTPEIHWFGYKKLQ